MLTTVLSVVLALFPISEIALAFVKRSAGGTAKSDDRGSMLLLWISIIFGVGLAIAAQSFRTARLPAPQPLIHALALALLLGGLALRWTAILTLGRLFTVDVAIQEGHIVFQRGVYRFMRHPSYTGLLVAFLGMGVFFSSWLSIAGLLIPIVLGVANRVAKEERALLASLGSEYAAYCARTKRFVPGLL